ncbi:MAG: permease-like cell division protein FtsX [Bacteroidales bacterium]|jgi:cell division transport system permease protein|nr:permease-like cell division protein FtsX [Bacteroidales bacterium]MBR6847906.1 permease-like cell division protein FtsX [Bacteroidales bacterium]
MSEKSSSKRRVAGSYFMSLMSIALVLFLLGVFALLIMHAKKLSNHLKENIGFEIVMNSNVKEANILRLQKELDAMPAVKSTEYITKEEAIRRLSDDLGEDFLQWLGNEENPLLPSIDVRFNAAWANNDSLNVIESQLLGNADIKEVYYQKSLVDLINQNVRRIGFALMIASVILLIIAVTLIRNTIRLSIYSKRFLVRSMQLVGATASYIRRPFIKSGISQGFFGALLADAFLALLLYGLNKRIPEMSAIQDYKIIIGIFIGIIILGILLGGLSTHSALRKYLNADVDRLYA